MLDDVSLRSLKWLRVNDIRGYLQSNRNGLKKRLLTLPSDISETQAERVKFSVKNNIQNFFIMETKKEVKNNVSAVKSAPAKTETAKESVIVPVKVETKKETTPTPEAEQVKALTAKIADLEKRLSAEPKDIESRIAYYKKKQELTQRYEKFLVQIERVRNLIEDVSEQNTEIADFENDKTAYRLCLMTPSNYRDDPAFCVTNAELIDNVLCLLLARMEIKSNDLRAELTA